MPDLDPRRSSTWQGAFAALPQVAPGRDAWPGIAARTPTPARGSTRIARFARRPGFGLALAASLMLALTAMLRFAALPPGDVPGTAHDSAIAASLEDLYAQSFRLESLLLLARDDRVLSASAANVGAELDARTAAIDAALAQPGLSGQQQLQLWRLRIDALREAGAFQSNRRWLAAHGERYDGALVRID